MGPGSSNGGATGSVAIGQNAIKVKDHGLAHNGHGAPKPVGWRGPG